MPFLRRFRNPSSNPATTTEPPPSWTPAPEPSHTYGLYDEAPEEEYNAAEDFCATHPLDPPKPLSHHQLDRIRNEGCAAWDLEVPTTTRFVGHIQRMIDSDGLGGLVVVKVTTSLKCQSVCILSDLPLMSGIYDIDGKRGIIYYEVTVQRMDGVIAVGTACRPYPSWRHPGWNRLSAGLHLDDGRKFFEDPEGGRDYMNLDLNPIYPGVTIGCGYELASARIFYTYDGHVLPTAFTGVYLPREMQDVFAAVGVEGCCELDVNFGGAPFKWKDGDQYQSIWRVEGHLG